MSYSLLSRKKYRCGGANTPDLRNEFRVETVVQRYQRLENIEGMGSGLLERMC
jgi:hypothetical protein